MATVDTIISAQLARADELSVEAIDKINDAITASMGYTSIVRPDFFFGSKVEVEPFEESADFSSDFNSQYNGIISALDPGLLTKMRGFLSEFFPDFEVCSEVVEQWICDQIQNGGMGLPIAVESAMFQRGRDRILMEGARQEDEISNRFASRGFSMPNGVMAKMLATIQREVNQKIADYNRDVIVEQAKIQVETTKFAVSQAVELKKSVISFMLDYIGRYLGIYQIAGQKGAGFVDAKRNMYNTMSDYYRTLIASEQIEVDKVKFKQTDALQWATGGADFFEKHLTRLTNAAMAGADSFARMASSAQQSVNAIASLGG
jgi:hypothetical protein